jgi:hypothetical protein
MNVQSSKIKKEAEMEQEPSEIMTVDDLDYKISEMSDPAKAQLSNIQFVNQQIQQLQNEWAVADTARLGYQAALRGELLKSSRE